MNEVAIKIQNLGKQYKLGARKEPYYSLRETLMGGVRSGLDRLIGKSSPKHEPEMFWALKDVSFEVKRGQVLGIIGRNGAGKSTLLKILSRITHPSTGRARLYGRVGSMLEVGTGFHPELTARENIFLSGAILGMSRTEIRSKFDEMVDFADVEEFIDTPVKRFSSGMYLRLAFGVMAFLEPEILLMDEILAVGDFHFQKKCLGRMDDISKEGKTILFVSHNMAAIQRLCPQTVLICDGRLEYFGATEIAVKKYIEGAGSFSDLSKLLWTASEDSHGFRDILKIRNFRVVDEEGKIVPPRLYSSKRYNILVEVEILKNDPKLIFSIGFYDKFGSLIFCTEIHDTGGIDFSSMKPGILLFSVPLPVEWFWNGVYQIELLAAFHYTAWIMMADNESRLRFEMVRDNDQNPYSNEYRMGMLAPVIKWDLTYQ